MSNLLTAEIIELLSPKPSQRLLIVTIGNDLRADDGLGPYIFEKCQIKNVSAKGGCASGAKCQMLNAGDKPENIIDETIALKPDQVVIIDAADFGGNVGEARIIPSEHIPDTTLSTHTFPLKVIAKLIKEDTKAKVYFLGVQPKSVELVEGLSAEVKATADSIIKLITPSHSPPC